MSQARARGGGRFDPYRVGILSGLQSVGGGHKNRALAHGYSLSTPAGFKDLGNLLKSFPRRLPRLAVPARHAWLAGSKGPQSRATFQTLMGR